MTRSRVTFATIDAAAIAALFVSPSTTARCCGADGPSRKPSTRQVSAGGGRWPVWHPKAAGKELFYLSPKGLMSLSAVTAPTFTPGRVSMMFETAAYNSANVVNSNRRLAVSPDGQRFLFLKAAALPTAAGQETQSLLFVENWIEELKQRLPAD